MSEQKSIALFLLLVLAFEVLFIILYRPDSYTLRKTSENHPELMNIGKSMYTAAHVLCGFIILVISRITFYYLNKKHDYRLRVLAIWIPGELIVLTLTLTCINFLFEGLDNPDFFDMLKDVFTDVIYVLIIPYAATVLILLLIERGHEIERLTGLIDEQEMGNNETNDNINFYALGGKLAFSTKRSNVLYIEAADNYSNIHYLNEGKEDTFVLHNSLKNLDNPEKYKGLLRCHRGYMVNTENVKLLRKEKDGLVLELEQTTRPIPVSRTYNDKVVKVFSGE